MRKQNQKSNAKSTFPTWVWVVAVLIIVAVGAMLTLQNMPAAQTTLTAEISVAQAAAKRDQGAFILDVRQPEEWNEGHIPDATLIPLGELPNRLNEVPKDREVVVVCRSGNRSQQGRDILRGAGYTLITSMAGGMNDWQSQGLPVVSGP